MIFREYFTTNKSEDIKNLTGEDITSMELTGEEITTIRSLLQQDINTILELEPTETYQVNKQSIIERVK